MSRSCQECAHYDPDFIEEACWHCSGPECAREPSNFEPNPRTNYDSIISKTPEELAKFMGELPCCPPGADVKELCYPMDSCEGTDLQVQCWLDWLKQEAR